MLVDASSEEFTSARRLRVLGDDAHVFLVGRLGIYRIPRSSASPGHLARGTTRKLARLIGVELGTAFN
jgi:hypothetical protein